MTNPRRKDGLYSTGIDDQMLIYDSTNQQTHCLNPQAMKVWDLCDGRHSREDMVAVLRADPALGVKPADAEDLVDAALDRFTDLNMLDAATHPTRRAVGKAAARAMAAGLVLSVLMPTRAMAGSVDCTSLGEDACLNDPSCAWVGVCINAG